MAKSWGPRVPRKRAFHGDFVLISSFLEGAAAFYFGVLLLLGFGIHGCQDFITSH